MQWHLCCVHFCNGTTWLDNQSSQQKPWRLLPTKHTTCWTFSRPFSPKKQVWNVCVLLCTLVYSLNWLCTLVYSCVQSCVLAEIGTLHEQVEARGGELSSSTWFLTSWTIWFSLVGLRIVLVKQENIVTSSTSRFWSDWPTTSKTGKSKFSRFMPESKVMFVSCYSLYHMMFCAFIVTVVLISFAIVEWIGQDSNILLVKFRRASWQKNRKKSLCWMTCLFQKGKRYLLCSCHVCKEGGTCCVLCTMYVHVVCCVCLVCLLCVVCVPSVCTVVCWCVCPCVLLCTLEGVLITWAWF